MLNKFLNYSIAIQLFYTLLVVAAIVNACMAFAGDIKTHWRIHFGLTSTVLSIYLLYVGLRLNDTIDVHDYTKLVQWLFPFMALCLIFPAVLIHWEKTFYRKALERISPEL